jgi:beta-glucuronidase
MKYLSTLLFIAVLFILNAILLFPQSAMINVQSRNLQSLNGKWAVIIDPLNVGEWRKVWEEKKPERKTDFFEYSFDGGPVLNVPGDFNSQLPELAYYEGVVWYKKIFTHTTQPGKRLFLHFGAVNYLASVYLNGKLIGNHEGGFTPFQFEITNLVVDGENTVIVKVDNPRLKDGIPGIGYDWFNYGGITRDVNLIETNETFIEDYFIQLKKNSFNEISGFIKLDGIKLLQTVSLNIPELNIAFKSKTNEKGYAQINFKAEPALWSFESPKLYRVIIQSETDTVVDEVGFRTIETKGTDIILNGKRIFLKGINIHEENPVTRTRAISLEDAQLLLGWAKDLGCNFVRLAHYPHNENTIKLAEKMGLMIWEEIPVYQHIDFAAAGVEEKINLMLDEMIKRDKNRCAVIIWSITNETYSSEVNRNNVLIKLANRCRELDSTRLISAALNTQEYRSNQIELLDPLYSYLDIMGINEYLGWYVPWQGKPKDVTWKFICNDKPVLITEYGGEALYGNNTGPKDEANYWNEDYQEQIYKDQIELFATNPNLAGVCPWILSDFRSLSRMNQLYQNGWNRKGLLSDKGEKKKAWFIMKNFYEGITDK